MGLAHLLRQLDELCNDLRRTDGAVLVAANCLLQHVGECAALNEVLSGSQADLVIQQLLKELEGYIPVGESPDFFEELIGQDGDVRVPQPSGGEDVDYFIGRHRLRDYLPNGDIKILPWLTLSWRR